MQIIKIHQELHNFKFDRKKEFCFSYGQVAVYLNWETNIYENISILTTVLLLKCPGFFLWVIFGVYCAVILLLPIFYDLKYVHIQHQCYPSIHYLVLLTSLIKIIPKIINCESEITCDKTVPKKKKRPSK